MQYNYNGTIKCKKEETEKVVSLLTLYLFKRLGIENRNLNGIAVISIEDEVRDEIVNDVEKFCDELKKQKVFVDGTICYTGDFDGRYVITNSEYRELSAESCVIMDSGDKELIAELIHRGYSVYKTPTEPEEEPEDGQEAFSVSVNYPRLKSQACD